MIEWVAEGVYKDESKYIIHVQLQKKILIYKDKFSA